MQVPPSKDGPEELALEWEGPDKFALVDTDELALERELMLGTGENVTFEGTLQFAQPTMQMHEPSKPEHLHPPYTWSQAVHTHTRGERDEVGGVGGRRVWGNVGGEGRGS